jgi:hypothetical protein
MQCRHVVFISRRSSLQAGGQAMNLVILKSLSFAAGICAGLTVVAFLLSLVGN